MHVINPVPNNKINNDLAFHKFGGFVGQIILKQNISPLINFAMNWSQHILNGIAHNVATYLECIDILLGRWINIGHYHKVHVNFIHQGTYSRNKQMK